MCLQVVIFYFMMCLPLRCSGVAAGVRGSSAAPHPHTVRGLVEEGAEGERAVWSHCFLHVSAEELHFEEISQYITSVILVILGLKVNFDTFCVSLGC